MPPTGAPSTCSASTSSDSTAATSSSNAAGSTGSRWRPPSATTPRPAPMTDPALLADVVVVELGDGIAGSVASATLGALGATVHKVVPAERRHGDHQPRVGRGSAIAAVLDRDKTPIDDHAAVALAPSADIVIVDA